MTNQIFTGVFFVILINTVFSNKNVSKVLTKANSTENNHVNSNNTENKNVLKELAKANSTENKNDTSNEAENKNVLKELTKANSTENNNVTSNNALNKNVSKELTQSNNTKGILKEEYLYPQFDNELNIVWQRYLAAKVVVDRKKLKIRRTTPMAMTQYDESDVIESSKTEPLETSSNKLSTFLDIETPTNSDFEENNTIVEIEEGAFNNNETQEQITKYIVFDGTYTANNTKLRRDVGAPVMGRGGGNRFINIRQPYWKGGHKVFLGHTTKPPKGEAPLTKHYMLEFDDCNPTCLHYFKTYGKVCGHRFNTMHWKNEYKNFTNICEMDLQNCNASDTKRPHWHPMYRGNCFVEPGYESWPRLSFDYEEILERKHKWAPFKYIQPTSSTSPTPP